MFSKTFPFWIVKTPDCLVLKLTREVSISSSAKNAFNHRHSLLPLQCFQKTFHFWIVKTRDRLVLKLMRDLFSIALRGPDYKSKDWRSWKLHWWRDLDILGLIDGHHPFTWQSCFYVIETALENRAERKKNLSFFTQGFLPIWLKFNGSSHIWLVFSNLTSLQFSWANAVTCNWQLPTELDLFIFRVDI